MLEATKKKKKITSQTAWHQTSCPHVIFLFPILVLLVTAVESFANAES